MKGLKFGQPERPSRKKKSLNVLAFQPPGNDPSNSQGKKHCKINEKSDRKIPTRSKQGIFVIGFRSDTYYIH
jgi:hypothetical protein